jgi:hypothetical protein
MEQAMRNEHKRFIRFMALLSCTASAAFAQPGADAPRLPDGRPDLSGTWDNGAGIDFVRPSQDGDSVCIVGCAAAPAATAANAPQTVRSGPPQYRPEFAARVADLSARQVEEDPVLRCLPPGLPRIGPPDKIVQRTGEAVFLYEDVSGSFFRIVPTDGRALPQGNEPSFLGDSVGHWEGDTLVVETANFNGQSWLTDNGAFHTKDLRVVERVRRVGNTLEWTATATDPAVLAEPWQAPKRVAQLTDLEIVESPPCIDRSLDHMVDDTHHTNPR